MRTTSPSRAPAVASARSTPMRRRRCCTYDDRVGGGEVGERDRALGRAALARATRARLRARPRSPAPPGRSTTNGSGSPSGVARFVDEHRDLADELVEPGACHAPRSRARRTPRSRRRPCCRRRRGAGRAARAGSGRSSSSSTALLLGGRAAVDRREVAAAPRARAPVRCGAGTGGRARGPRPRLR